MMKSKQEIKKWLDELSSDFDKEYQKAESANHQGLMALAKNVKDAIEMLDISVDGYADVKRKAISFYLSDL